MSGTTLFMNGHTIREEYSSDLSKLKEGDSVGVMCTHLKELHFYVNGQDQGVAKTCLSFPVWAVVDLYGKCSKVSISGCDSFSLSGDDNGEDVCLLFYFCHMDVPLVVDMLYVRVFSYVCFLFFTGNIDLLFIQILCLNIFFWCNRYSVNSVWRTF